MSSKLTEKYYLNSRWQAILHYCAFAFVLFGVKLALIANYGNATPVWDQWDAEAHFLYRPYLEGNLRLVDLFALHNEHRIFTTRLLALGLLEVNHIWNPLLQMVINAALHIVSIILCINFLIKVVGTQNRKTIVFFAFILFALPYAWENTLTGFQAQFYFVFMFSTICIWLLVDKEPLSLYWWCGLASGMFAFLSFASGIIAVAAAASISIVQYALKVRRSKNQILSLTILITLIVIGVFLTPTIAGHAGYKATSGLQFFDALFATLSWPLHPKFVKGVFLQLPALVFVCVMLMQRPIASDKRWFLLGLVVWVFGQAVSIAYGRATSFAASRYLDLFAIGILVNFTCLLSILQTSFFKNYAFKNIFLSIWLLAIIMALGKYTYSNVPEQLKLKYENGLAQEINIKNYLIENDIKHLKNKPLDQIPYPNAERLAMILESEYIQKILPSNIKKSINPGVQFNSSRLDIFVRYMLEHYAECIMLGLACSIIFLSSKNMEKNKNFYIHLNKYRNKFNYE